MARGRMINKQLAKSRRFDALEDDFSRLLYCMLLPHADRDGRLEGDPHLVKAMCFPRRDDVSCRKIADSLRQITATGLIEWYEVDEEAYIEISKFKENQEGLRYDREPESRIQAPCGTLPAVAGSLPEDDGSLPVEVKLREENINTCASRSAYTSDFEKWWFAYPKKRSKDAAFKVWKKVKSKLPPLDAHIEAVNAWSLSDDWTKDGGQFIPYPQKWLSEGKWMDELPGRSRIVQMPTPKFCPKHNGRPLEPDGTCAMCEEEKGIQGAG